MMDWLPVQVCARQSPRCAHSVQNELLSPFLRLPLKHARHFRTKWMKSSARSRLNPSLVLACGMKIFHKQLMKAYGCSYRMCSIGCFKNDHSLRRQYEQNKYRESICEDFKHGGSSGRNSECS